ALLVRAATAEGPRWFALHGRSGDFEAERIGQLAGLSPQEVGALPPIENCTSALCTWKTPALRRGALVLSADGFATACIRSAIVIARVPPPSDWRSRCQPARLITPDDLVAQGGASVTERPRGIVARFASASSLRPWARAP